MTPLSGTMHMYVTILDSIRLSFQLDQIKMWPTYPIPMVWIFYLTNYIKTIEIVLNLILCLWILEAKFLILYVFSLFVLVSLKFAPKFPNDNNSKLVHVIVWHLKWQGITWIDHHLVRWSIYFRLCLNWSKLQNAPWIIDNLRHHPLA